MAAYRACQAGPGRLALADRLGGGTELLDGPAGCRLAWWAWSEVTGERGAGGWHGHPDSGPAAAGVREFHAG